MSDPIDEIFNGKPDGIDEDELKQMQQQEAVNAAAAETAAQQAQEEQKPSSPTTTCLLYTSPSPRDRTRSRMPSSA